MWSCSTVAAIREKKKRAKVGRVGKQSRLTNPTARGEFTRRAQPPKQEKRKKNKLYFPSLSLFYFFSVFLLVIILSCFVGN